MEKKDGYRIIHSEHCDKMNHVKLKYLKSKIWTALLNNYGSTFIFMFLLSFSFPQESDPNKIFDPDQHRDIQPKWPVIVNSVFQSDNAIDSILTSDTVYWITEGFRVQILATKSMTKADSLSAILNTVLQDSIYVVYETPNYKVRVGDYIVRAEAEETRQYLSNIGYPSAWIIRTRITPQQSGKMIRNY